MWACEYESDCQPVCASVGVLFYVVHVVQSESVLEMTCMTWIEKLSSVLHIPQVSSLEAPGITRSVIEGALVNSFRAKPAPEPSTVQNHFFDSFYLSPPPHPFVCVLLFLSHFVCLNFRVLTRRGCPSSLEEVWAVSNRACRACHCR